KPEPERPGISQGVQLAVVGVTAAPIDLERRDASLVGGSLNEGTAALDQQLIFRPTAVWAARVRRLVSVPGLSVSASGRQQAGVWAEVSRAGPSVASSSPEQLNHLVRPPQPSCWVIR